MSFAQGFEKEAGLKHWLAAAAIAGSPAKAKAGDAIQELGRAAHAYAKTTPTGQAVEHNINKFVDKARNIRLWGEAAEEAGSAAIKASGGSAASAAKKVKPSLNIKDGKRVQLDYGRFHAHADQGERGLKVDLGKGSHFSVADTGRGSPYFSVGFQRNF